MLSKISIKTRLGMLLGVLITLLVVLGTIRMISDHHISSHISRSNENVYPLALNSTYLQLWIERSLAIINAAALAGRSDLLNPLEEAELSLKEYFRKLNALIHHFPNLVGKLRALEQGYIDAKTIGLQWVDATLAEDWELEPKLNAKFVQLRAELEQTMTILKNEGVAGFSKSLDQIANHMQNAWSMTLAIFALSLFGFIGLTFGLYRSIASPIQDLLQGIEDVQADTAQVSPRVAVDSRDEIGQLANAFNRMLNDLEISQAKLRQHNEQLEDLVQERTAQLEQEKKALQESEGHRKAIWDSTPSGIIVVDAKSHRIVDANPFSLKLMGRTLQETIGKVCYNFICPAEENKCPITDLGQTVDGSERRLVTTDGHEIPILKTVVPLSAQGQDLLIESFVDMTSLKEAQENLRTALSSAESANKAKSAFLASMSHELRTPLNHIIGFTQLVLDKNFGDLTDVQEEYLNDVLTSSQHLLALINDVLDLSKVEAGKMYLDLSDVNVAQLLEDSLIVIKEKALKHGLSVGIDIGEIPESIQADGRKLKQIVYNLLSNAVKFTPDGGEIQLSAKLFSTTSRGIGNNGGNGVSAHGSRKDTIQPMIHIAVSDNGIGLLPHDQEKIFSPFEQARTRNNQVRSGTGLGLAISKKFVELHGGQIWAESEGKNKGSTFHVMFPFPT